MNANKPNLTAMPKQQLGPHGPVVSRLALGTMTVGFETDEAESHRMLDLFADMGGTFIDTADVYSAGVSEEIIGRWIKKRGGQGELILATKTFFAPLEGSHGGSRSSIVWAVDSSLKRLQVDAIDVYYMHAWDFRTEIEETLAALGDMINAGKIRNIAWSNVTGWQLQKILLTADRLGVPRPVALQPQYNLLDRIIELEVMPCCLENGISLAPWSPLGGGWLTGKYRSGTKPEGKTRLGEDPTRGVEAYSRRNNERTYRVLDVLENIAGRHKKPMSHVALGWLLCRPGVATLLLGARTAEQLKENLGAVSLELGTEEINALTEISAHGIPDYPYGFLTENAKVPIWKDLGT